MIAIIALIVAGSAGDRDFSGGTWLAPGAPRCSVCRSPVLIIASPAWHRPPPPDRPRWLRLAAQPSRSPVDCGRSTRRALTRLVSARGGASRHPRLLRPCRGAARPHLGAGRARSARPRDPRVARHRGRPLVDDRGSDRRAAGRAAGHRHRRGGSPATRRRRALAARRGVGSPTPPDAVTEQLCEWPALACRRRRAERSPAPARPRPGQLGRRAVRRPWSRRARVRHRGRRHRGARRDPARPGPGARAGRARAARRPSLDGRPTSNSTMSRPSSTSPPCRPRRRRQRVDYTEAAAAGVKPRAAAVDRPRPRMAHGSPTSCRAASVAGPHRLGRLAHGVPRLALPGGRQVDPHRTLRLP